MFWKVYIVYQNMKARPSSQSAENCVDLFLFIIRLYCKQGELRVIKWTRVLYTHLCFHVNMHFHRNWISLSNHWSVSHEYFRAICDLQIVLKHVLSFGQSPVEYSILLQNRDFISSDVLEELKKGECLKMKLACKDLLSVLPKLSFSENHMCKVMSFLCSYGGLQRC